MSDLAKVLSALSEKLGVPAQMLWEALRRQAFIEGCTDLVLIVFLVAFTFASTKALIYAWRKTAEGKWDDAPVFLATLFTGTFVVIGWLMVFACLPTLFAAFFNPDYWALHQVLSLLGGK